MAYEPVNAENVAHSSEALGIHDAIHYSSRQARQLHVRMVPTSRKRHKVWSAADEITVELEIPRLNATELSAYCWDRSLYPERLEHWQQTAQGPRPIRILSQ